MLLNMSYMTYSEGLQGYVVKGVTCRTKRLHTCERTRASVHVEVNVSRGTFEQVVQGFVQGYNVVQGCSMLHVCIRLYRFIVRFERTIEVRQNVAAHGVRQNYAGCVIYTQVWQNVACRQV